MIELATTPVPTLADTKLWRLKQPEHGGNALALSYELAVAPERILDFSSNVNPLGPPKIVLRALREELRYIGYHPDQHATALRSALASHFQLSRESLIVGNGCSDLIQLLTITLLDKGGEALILIPTYTEYERSTRIAGGKPRYIDSLGSVNIVEDILRVLNPKTKIVFLCNPNNPTGTSLTKRRITRIIERANEVRSVVVLDESFIELSDMGENLSCIHLVKEFDNVVVLRSFTKAYALAGLRVGYAAASRQVVGTLSRIKVPWSVNHLAQVAALAALKAKGYLEQARKLIRAERRYLSENIYQFDGMRVWPSHVNFFLLDTSRSGLKARVLRTHLLQSLILIRDCSSFRGLGPHYARISVRTRPDNRKLVRALTTVVEQGSEVG